MRSARRSLTHLDVLEAEAIHIIREVAAEFERPVLLFSGGKDSIVLLRLAEKAFRPAPIPFPVMHVDTGHNFPEVLEFRDRRGAGARRAADRRLGAGVDRRRPRRSRRRGPRASRNRLQTVTLLDAIAEHGFDAAFGGARRDEERARAKERILSFRDDFGQWDPRAQRPELWNLYNGRVRRGEHVRAFPISNWTELDVWQYIAQEALELPHIYFAHEREVFERDGMLYAVSDHVELVNGERPFTRVRPLPHRRRPDGHRRGALGGADARGGHRRDRGDPHHRARPDARRRPRVASPPWRTASARATSSHGPPAPRHRRLRRRRQVDPDRPPAARREVADGRRGRGGRRRPRAADRRPARRARAGHHDRRRLPPLRHAAAALHPRRLPRPRAVHAQHGHRRVDRRAGARAGGRPPRRHRPDAPPRRRRRAARRPPRRRVRQQDGPRRLLRGALRRDRARLLRAGVAARAARRRLPADLGAARRQRRRRAPRRCPGTRARRCSSCSRRCRWAPSRRSSPRASRCRR